MIKASAKLYVLILNKHTLEHDIVSLSKSSLSIPSVNLTSENSLQDSLSILFESCVDLSAAYAKYKLYDAEIINETLILSYMCLLPFSTTIKNSHLMPAKQYANYSPNLQKIISLL